MLKSGKISHFLGFLMRYKNILWVLALLLSLGKKSILCGQEWVVGQDTHTVFFQGMMASQIKAANYDPKGVRATTGEYMKCPDANPLAYQPYIGKELDEIRLAGTPKHSWYNPLRYVDTLQHYLWGRQNQNYGYIVTGTKPGKRSVLTHAVDFFKLNFGQERDGVEFLNKIQRCKKQYPHANIVALGTSRGAMAIINGAKNTGDIKMVILEGCPDTVAHTMQLRAAWVLRKVGITSVLHYLLSCVTEYKTDGITPIKSVVSFPENIPVVVITSKADKNVPKECTDKLVELLKKRNKNPVHYLVLEKAHHNFYPLGKGKDQIRYLKFLHTLYKKYGLPYIEKYAKQKKE